MKHFILAALLAIPSPALAQQGTSYSAQVFNAAITGALLTCLRRQDRITEDKMANLYAERMQYLDLGVDASWALYNNPATRDVAWFILQKLDKDCYLHESPPQP